MADDDVALEKAYNAGRALPSVQWPEDASDEQRTPGPHHCPFSPGDPQRERWLEGLRDALSGPTADPATIIRQIDDELEVAPMLAELMDVKGTCLVQVFDENGEEREDQRREVENLVVTTGRDAIMERLDSTPATAQPSHMEVGTGATAVAAGQTALTTALDRNALTSSTAAGAVLTMVGNWAAGDATSATIQEAGVFNNVSAGTMYSRATFTAINKGASDTLQITWTYTLTPS